MQQCPGKLYPFLIMLRIMHGVKQNKLKKKFVPSKFDLAHPNAHGMHIMPTIVLKMLEIGSKGSESHFCTASCRPLGLALPLSNTSFKF
mmetsp:Transcript_10823/g.16141  ORF Transcript_10823/g.16141 Transcript_10823/m.16141 type:complete len:89 (-) Transcript_10823:366-632(-)